MPGFIELLRSKAAVRHLSIAVFVPVFLFANGTSVAPAQSPQAVKPVTVDVGTRTYMTHCAACHQENGRGVGAAFPPLAGHVPNLLAQAGGRDYLIRVVLFGLEGVINVNGQSFSGVMPAWEALDDGEIAAVLNHLATAWENRQRLAADFKPFQSNEIAAARTARVAPAAVHTLRQKLFPQAGQADAKSSAASALTFTDEQVAQGRAAYQHNCMDCHGAKLDDGEFGGAPLRGSHFRKRWGEGSVASLYAYTKSRMPPDRPGGLSDKVYADVVAYLLQANGYKAGGTELPSDPQAQQSMSLKRD